MLVAKEIRNKISSVQNTKKITKTMEIIAASKMRKSQDCMIASRPYTNIICKIINHLTNSNLKYKHPYLEERKIRRVGYIVVSTDRGLCGSLNINLFRKILVDIKFWCNEKVQCDLALIGSKSVSFFKNIGINIAAQVTGIGENPSIYKLMGLIKAMTQTYDEGRLDRLYIANNKFVSIMSQVPTINQLLPIKTVTDNEVKYKTWDYLYEPDPKQLLDSLLRRYLESQVYQSVIENLANEQAARMVAMKAATDSSSDLVKELLLVYNKARQTSITQELIEIISGYDAV